MVACQNLVVPSIEIQKYTRRKCFKCCSLAPYLLLGSSALQQTGQLMHKGSHSVVLSPEAIENLWENAPIEGEYL